MALCILKAVKSVPFSLSIILTVYMIYSWRGESELTDNPETETSQYSHVSYDKENIIHLAVVACEGKTKRVLDEALTMIKSAVIFTMKNLHVHIFTNTLKTDFEREFSRWPTRVVSGNNVKFYPVKYPLSPENESELKDWWGPCASFRLFLPQVLTQTDAVIYVDTDVIFLGPIEDLWDHFSRFDSIQVGALAPRVGWDFKVPESNPNFIRKPDGKLTQVNSGVFLMNLTRMREQRFLSDPGVSLSRHSWKPIFLLPLYNQHKKDMYGDQNLINVVFHYNPDLLYLLPCNFNYHHKFCFDSQQERQCESAERDGAVVVHGSANTYYNNYSPAFAAINKAFRQYDFGEDLSSSLLQPMIKYLRDPDVEYHKHCGGKTELFLRHTRSIINKKMNKQ